MKNTIFGQTKEIWSRMYERLLREKEQTDLPEHRKREVESSLYFIGEILRKFERKEE